MGKNASEREFAFWLTTQANARGLPYKATVANRYAACLRTEPLKLDIPLTTRERDIYHCRALEDFDRLTKIFRAAPNFQEVNGGSGRGAFSAGLSAYRKYVCYLECGTEAVPTAITDPEFWEPNMDGCNSSKQSDATIPNVILDVLRSTYSGGFRFETTSLSLLASSSGVQIDKKMTPIRTARFERADRTAVGHRVTVTYRAGLFL